ncbi:DNA ligase D [Chitiniphilus eburneus]|uniref:DNA ligase (ATP) n=1 Tax=Chitiniphilus eburneus TaxID=2571148 RepID=A0A4U0PYZ6_9NEIS|nr:DNA ligase D [Chitiniphilus eburneus]TJZ73799.1 DNA ligase D [Chitiniphilus eburneus]
MSLERYWQKRDFAQTPEPRGTVAQPAERLAFFVQKHAARRLHYDFRLELEGTLKSWAVPKGPSLDPHEKRLAVQVEDHPLDYGDFEGTIPPRQYGAGSVLLWDRGIWTPLGDPVADYRKGHLRFTLDGDKLSGQWSLVRMAPREGEKQENWLLIKSDDDEARHGPDAEITELRPESVKGLHPRLPPRAETGPDRARPRRAPRKSASTLPVMLQPQLASLVAQAPSGEGWLAEVKYDGYRILARVNGDGEVALFSRNGNDWTRRMPDIAQAVAALGTRNSWLDGEVVAIDTQGRISFQALQNAFAEGGKPARLLYYLFDLLYLKGEDQRERPQLERKRRLQRLLRLAGDASPLRYSDHIDGQLGDVFHHACQHGLEGVVVKRADAPYAAARTRNWLKVKCSQRQEFVIGGYTEPSGSRNGFGALLLGVHDAEGRLVYAGRVGTGFNEATLATLAARLKPLKQRQAPFDNPPRGREAAGAHWVKPTLVAEVRFADWTEQGLLRQAAFIGLREDKPPATITRETAQPLPPAPRRTRTAARQQPVEQRTKGPARTDDVVAGVTITHPSRIVYAEGDLTKLDLARYYERVANHILPHLKNRPLSLVRCPQGATHGCFFQKHLGDALPDSVNAVTVPTGDGESATYMMVNDLEALISLVQFGVMEFHTWGARGNAPTQPDRLIFDLDPAPDVPWARVREAAQLTRGFLEELGLRSFLKTTGGKGLHVEVPLVRGPGWNEAKAFARGVAEHLAAEIPQRFTTKLAKSRRGGKIFIDYLRNSLGATAVAAFSTRARPGAPVATPLFWEELDHGIESAHFNIDNLAARLRDTDDPWAEYDSSRQRLTTAMRDVLTDAARRRP